jgi:predicted  nucleic acid-binding Zn-ribbon protein
MHKCLRCGKIFERLTDAMLKGCPDCGGKLFLYLRPGEELSAAELVERIEVDEQAPVEGEQIESLRILSPGVYELNLDALLERKEIVMRIKKDGTYVVPLSALFRKKGSRK